MAFAEADPELTEALLFSDRNGVMMQRPLSQRNPYRYNAKEVWQFK